MDKNLLEATRLLPCPVVLLSVGTKGKQDAMTATAMFVAEDVPLLTVSVAKSSTCHKLIEETGEFALNIASAVQVGLAKQLGASHGAKVDKFKKFSIGTEKATQIASPLIAGSSANFECKVITSSAAANYTVYLAQVVAYKAADAPQPLSWYQNKYFGFGKQVK
ncbi:MAG: flavin reductase family protein [Desulfobacterales bacterium]|nr:flavin reductase family protein [Desulfobacterales bacterium]